MNFGHPYHHQPPMTGGSREGWRGAAASLPPMTGVRMQKTGCLFGGISIIRRVTSDNSITVRGGCVTQTPQPPTARKPTPTAQYMYYLRLLGNPLLPPSVTF